MKTTQPIVTNENKDIVINTYILSITFNSIYLLYLSTEIVVLFQISSDKYGVKNRIILPHFFELSWSSLPSPDTKNT